MAFAPAHLNLSIRARPPRLAFVIGPRDRDALRRAIQINTCLWAGRFNPILPLCPRRPARWDPHLRQQPTGQEILLGYLASFEPDYLVLIGTDLPKRFPFPRDRVISESGLLDGGGSGLFSIGISVADVFRHLYQEEMRFSSRDRIGAVLPAPASRDLALFVGAVFGEYPSDGRASVCEAAYQKTFEPESVLVDAAAFSAIVSSWDHTPLRAGSWCGSRHFQDSAQLRLLLLDPEVPRDILEFWNLRAYGYRVVPIPRPWIPDVAALVQRLEAEAVTRSEQPSLQSRIELHWTLRFSKPQAHAAWESFGTRQPRSMALVGGSPALWDPPPRLLFRMKRAELDFRTDRLEPTVGPDLRYSFNTRAVPFAPETVGYRSARWIEVVEPTVRGFSSDPELASALPAGLTDVGRLLDGLDTGNVWTTTEGITYPATYEGFPVFWQVPRAIELVRLLLKPHGLDLMVSGAGQVARSLVKCLGGVRGVGLFDDRNLLEQINSLAHGTADGDSAPGDLASARKRRTRVGTFSRSEVMKILLSANAGSEARAERHLARLCERDVFRVGLRVQCPHCQQRTWFKLAELDDRLACDRCLQEFRFPAHRPPESWQEGWHYRPVGPFSIEGYAQGAYVVAFALRFFHEFFHHEAAWVPPFEILERGEKVGEVDFGIISGRRGLHEVPQIVFGECKAGNHFAERDLKGLLRLATALPEVSLAICTLESSLTKGSRTTIRQAFLEAPGSAEHQRFAERLIILTETELLAQHSPPTCWKEAKDERIRRIGERWRYAYTPENLARATQELHLQEPVRGVPARGVDDPGPESGQGSTKTDKAGSGLGGLP